MVCSPTSLELQVCVVDKKMNPMRLEQLGALLSNLSCKPFANLD